MNKPVFYIFNQHEELIDKHIANNFYYNMLEGTLSITTNYYDITYSTTDVELIEHGFENTIYEVLIITE